MSAAAHPSADAAAPLALPQVTLCCVDSRYPQLAAFAIAHCRRFVRVADALIFTAPQHLAAIEPTMAGGPVRVLPVQIDTLAAYSHFMHRGLAPHVHTSHALVVQWDGLVRDAAAWDPAFLGFDYIGAPWPDAEPLRAVGNGGFSLRSKKLLDALLDPDVKVGHPEDVSICVDNRQLLEERHGVRFAPLEVAGRFAYERTRPPASVPATFGFHGQHNFQRELPADDLHRLVSSLPAALTRTKEAVDLCRTLIDAGAFDTAAAIVAKRREIGLQGSRTLRLAARLAWARLTRRG